MIQTNFGGAYSGQTIFGAHYFNANSDQTGDAYFGHYSNANSCQTRHRCRALPVTQGGKGNVHSTQEENNVKAFYSRESVFQCTG